MIKTIYFSAAVLFMTFVVSCSQPKQMGNQQEKEVQLITVEQATAQNVMATRYVIKADKGENDTFRYNVSFPKTMGWKPLSLTVGQQTLEASLGQNVGEINNVFAEFNAHKVWALTEKEQNEVVLEVMVNGENKSFKFNEVVLAVN